jgi:hypothetical protein
VDIFVLNMPTSEIMFCFCITELTVILCQFVGKFDEMNLNWKQVLFDDGVLGFHTMWCSVFFPSKTSEQTHYTTWHKPQNSIV